jgi:hypothetical protein
MGHWFTGFIVYWQCRKSIGKTWGLKGGVLDIHFGNKTDVEKCGISLVETHLINVLCIRVDRNIWEA